MSNLTFTFKELFPNLATFKTFASETGIDVDHMTADDLVVLEHTYYILYSRYSIANVRYTTPEAFYGEMGITFDDEFRRYLKRYKLIANAYNLTNEDFEILNRAVSNYANNPNDEVQNPLDPLTYISSQTYNAQFSNKLQAYLLAIETLPSEYDEDFLAKFKHLFINIIPKDIPLYIEKV